MSDRIKLTEKDIEVQEQDEYSLDDRIWISTHTHIEAEQLKQQILQDQEKADNLDSLLSYFMCDNFKQLEELLKARSHQLLNLLVKK